MLDHLKFLSFPKESINPESYRNWLKHPCTLELKKSLVAWHMEELSRPVPPTFDQTIIAVHQREGALSALDYFFEWEPESIRDARQSGKGMEVSDED